MESLLAPRSISPALAPRQRTRGMTFSFPFPVWDSPLSYGLRDCDADAPSLQMDVAAGARSLPREGGLAAMGGRQAVFPQIRLEGRNCGQKGGGLRRSSRKYLGK